MKAHHLIAIIVITGAGVGIALGALGALASKMFAQEPKPAVVIKTPPELQGTRCVVYRCEGQK